MAIMSNPASSPDLLTVDALARRWQTSKVTLWRMRRLGRIRAVKIGRGVRFRLSDVEKLEQDATE
jgi:excisionase family DNA binding protein